MRLLLTNDDGIYAPGLWTLFRHLGQEHHVEVVAPDQERSAVGHGITLARPLRSWPVRLSRDRVGIAVNGTPADCVKLGLAELTASPPEMVISGINPGANVGINIHYSGTVAAAKEAALAGLPAIAVSSAGRNGDADECIAEFLVRLIRSVAANGLPRGTLLNVNYPDLPPDVVPGVRICPQGQPAVDDWFERRIDPRQTPYFWPGGDAQRFDDCPDTDGYALADRHITITPLTCDVTDHGFLATLRDWPITAGASDGD